MAVIFTGPRLGVQGLENDMATKKQKRTELLLAGFQGNPDEFMMLKGVLCAPLGLDFADELRLRKFFDYSMIAARMDAMNAAAIAEAKKLLPATTEAVTS